VGGRLRKGKKKGGKVRERVATEAVGKDRKERKSESNGERFMGVAPLRPEEAAGK